MKTFLAAGKRYLSLWHFMRFLHPSTAVSCKVYHILTFAFFLFLFILFFAVTFNYAMKHNKEFIFPDTYSYPGISIKHPWESLRTPGFDLYLIALGADKPLSTFLHDNPSVGWQQKNQLIRSNAFVQSFFRNLCLANAFFLSLGLCFLSFALGKVIPPSERCLWFRRILSASFVLFCTCNGMLVPINRVGADALALILVPYAAGALLLFFHRHKFRWLLVASLLASYSFLVKPSFASLSLICGLICAWELVKNLFRKHYARARSAFLIGLLLSLTTLAWPLWLFWHGGLFVPSQISAYTNLGFVFYLTQPGDENLVQDEKSKKILLKIQELQPIVAKRTEERVKELKLPPADLSSLQLYYYCSINHVIWTRMLQTLREVGINLKHLEVNKEISALAPIIIREHFKDYVKIVASSFLSAFNQLPLKRTYHARAKFISSHYKLTAFIILLALLFGMRQMRSTLLILISIHILHILFCSIGSIAETRYVAITEFCMLLAFLLALYSLIFRLLQFFLVRFPAVSSCCPTLCGSFDSICPGDSEEQGGREQQKNSP